MSTKIKRGKIHDDMTLFLRETAGSAKDKANAIEYEMSTDIGCGAPIIRSSLTGQWFTLSWHDIIALAIENGINEKGQP